MLETSLFNCWPFASIPLFWCFFLRARGWRFVHVLKFSIEWQYESPSGPIISVLQFIILPSSIETWNELYLSGNLLFNFTHSRVSREEVSWRNSIMSVQFMSGMKWLINSAFLLSFTSTFSLVHTPTIRSFRDCLAKTYRPLFNIWISDIGLGPWTVVFWLYNFCHFSGNSLPAFFFLFLEETEAQPSFPNGATSSKGCSDDVILGTILSSIFGLKLIFIISSLSCTFYPFKLLISSLIWKMVSNKLSNLIMISIMEFNFSLGVLMEHEIFLLDFFCHSHYRLLNHLYIYYSYFGFHFLYNYWLLINAVHLPIELTGVPTFFYFVIFWQGSHL